MTNQKELTQKCSEQKPLEVFCYSSGQIFGEERHLETIDKKKKLTEESNYLNNLGNSKTKEEKENLAWANFHNGVSSALKIHQDSFRRISR